ncbi:hypothetical protein [Corallococcus sp. AB018]|uniref:hypothetical protein n=1 Tax=Corallococcus sp. AB018 TaxID=2316715 RepID=UPI000F881E15|nr:hypothetical protein [Corallococcus sp. AB018]
MGDFIECRYANACPEAVMIGFFHNKNISYWHTELRRAFNEDSASSAPRLGIKSHPTPVEILPGLTGELESNHIRTDKSSMRLLHIFLDCSSA